MSEQHISNIKQIMDIAKKLYNRNTSEDEIDLALMQCYQIGKKEGRDDE